MVRIDFTVEVERDAQEVFDYLTDLARLPEWQSSAVESRAHGPLAEVSGSPSGAASLGARSRASSR